MKTREFDPVLSAALRNELAALPREEPEIAPVSGWRRPQVWVTAVTAVVLLVAVIGVLRFTAPAPQPADPVVPDPLAMVTTPGDPNYVARAVDVLLDVRGSGPGLQRFDLPADVEEATVYLTCAPSSDYSIDVLSDSESDGATTGSGSCGRRIGGSFGVPLEPGAKRLAIEIPASTEYALLVIAAPDPTVSTGPLIDPLAQVRDRRNPDAVIGSTSPLLRAAGTGTSAARAFAVPSDVDRVRVLLACTPSSSRTEVRIGGHTVSGCMNSIAHWFDFTPTEPTVTAQVVGSTAWSLLVIPAPDDAVDSPENLTLPYRETGRRVLARARGAGGQATGTYTRAGEGIVVWFDCVGTGWLEFSGPDGATSTRGTACSDQGSSVGFSGGDPGQRARWTVTPHGDVSWAVQITESGD